MVVSSIILATVKCLRELKFDYKRILRELSEPSVRGESVPHPKTVGASETLADGEVRPGPADPSSPEGEAIRSYVRWKSMKNRPHRTYERGHGTARSIPVVDDSNFYSKNDFMTFVRESSREASSTGIQPKCQEWYGSKQAIPWLQLALSWVNNPPNP